MNAPTKYDADSMRCPFCEQPGLRMQYGAYVCDRCDVAHGHNHITAWNNGFKAGKRQSVKVSDASPNDRTTTLENQKPL